MKNESYYSARKLITIVLQTFFLLFSFSLYAQIDCSSGPSPQIITDVINNCQDIKGLNGDHKPDDCIHVCVNTTINYEGIISTGSTVEWQAAGGTIVSSINSNPVSVEWTSVGNGSIILTETNTNGCIATTELCIVIDDGPTAGYTAFPEIVSDVINICEGGEVFFSDNSSDDVVAWEWDFGDGSFSNLENPNHIFDNPTGTYIVNLTVYNDCGCPNSKIIEVIVNNGWTPIIECISTTCKGNEGIYSVTNLDDCPGATFEWTAQNGMISNPNSNPVTITWGEAANGYLGVSIEGCGTICPATSYVNVPIIGAIGSIYGPTTVCVGDVVQFSVPYQPGSIFKWLIDGVFYSNEINTIDYTWSSAGSHTVEIDIISLGIICPESVEHITLNVEVLPKFDFDIENKVCYGKDLPLTFLISNPGPSVSFEAYNNMGVFIEAVPNSSTELFTNNLMPGTYQIIATAPGYCSDPVQVLTVLEPTVEPISADVTGEFTVCLNSIHEYEYAIPANMVPTWSVIGGTIIGNPSSDNVVVEWDGSGVYELFISQVDINNINCPSNAVSIGITQFLTSPLVINTIPVGGITDFCSDGLQTFMASPDVNVSDYNWSIDPDFAGSIISGNHTSTIDVEFHAYNGIATIQLDADICESSILSELEINIHDFDVVIGSFPATVCQNDNVVFAANVPGLPLGTFVNYEWFIDGVPAGITGNLSFPSAGTSTITVTATLSGGSCNGRVLTDIVSVIVIPSPIANITAPNGTIFTGMNLPLIASTQIDPDNPSATYSYSWSTGSNTNTATATAAGMFFVTVTNNTTGCSTIDHINIVVPSEPLNTCNGYTMIVTENCGEVTVSTTPSTSDVTWTFGDQSNAIFGAGPHIHNYAHSGVYFITAIIETSPNVYCILQENVTIEFIPQFISNYECGPTNNMITHLIDQTDFIVDQSLLSYTWTLPVGASVVSGSLTTSLVDIDFGALTAPQNVTLTVNGPGGPCVYSELVDFPVPIEADFAFDDPRCVNADVFFETALFGYALNVSYEWDFGDGAASNNSEPSRSFSNSGFQNVNLTLTDEYGCNSTVSYAIQIEASPYGSGITMSPLDPTFCAGDDVDLVYTSLSTGEVYTWTQDIDFDLGNNAPILPNVSSTGLYQLYVVDDIGCDDMSDLNQVVVTPVPLASVRGQDSYCFDDAVKLIAYAGDGVSYAWSINGNVVSETSYTLEFIAGFGLYMDGIVIQVEVTDDASGCSVLSDPFTINVLNGPSIAVTSMNDCVPANFSVSSSGSISVAQYVWSNGDLGTNATYYSGDAGSIVAYSSDGCRTTFDFDVHEGPDVSNIAVGCYCIDKKKAEWHFSPVGPGYTYHIDEVGVGTTVTSNPYYVFPNSGIYTITVVDAYGCSTTTDPIILDLDNCNKCDLKLEYKHVECLGYDVVSGGFLYEFTVTYYNNGGAGLNGLAASSSQVSVNGGSMSPSSIAGGSSGTITGTFIGNPGQEDICILIEGAGSDGLFCKDEFCIEEKLPECKDCKGCHLTLKEPKVECINYVDERNYFTFSMEYYNKDCPLIDMIWIIEKDDFELTLDNNYVASNSSGFITGNMYLPVDVSGWIKFGLVGINPYTGEKCDYTVEFYIPECKYDYKCDELKVVEGTVNYYGVNDTWDNQLYVFDIILDCPISDGDVMIFPLDDQTENQVSQLNVVTTGNTYHLTGLLTDFLEFNDKACFYIAVYKDGKFCYTKICIEVKYQFSSKLTDNTDLKYIDENKIYLAPNPASTRVDVAFDLDIEKSSFVEVRVFNQLGQVVHYFKGLNSDLILPIDVSNDKSGLYNVVLLVNGKLTGVSRYIVEK